MKIQYDKRTIKILGMIMLLSALWNLTGWATLFFELDFFEFELTGIFAIGGIVMGGVLFLYSLAQLVEGLGYIRRLKAHGYEVPFNKRDYGNSLHKLPCFGDGKIAEGKSKESLALCILFWCVFLFSNIWNAYYAIHWYGYLEENALFLTKVLIFLDLFWMIMAIVFFFQRNNKKYRDDVDKDLKRKVRMSLERGIVTCVIVLIIVSYVKCIVVEMSEYVYRSRMDSDQTYLVQIQNAVKGALAVNTSDESYKQMQNGCYISDWTVPADEFSQAIADNLGISDFSQIEERIYTSDGKPVIYVEIAGQEVYVRMENPMWLNSKIQRPYETALRNKGETK